MLIPIPVRPRVAAKSPPASGSIIVPSLPLSFSVPNGMYALNRDFTVGSATGTRAGVVTVTADDVTIDGCGQTIKWFGGTTQEPRCIWMANGRKGLKVKNLNIEWFGTGLKSAVIVQGSAEFENVHIKSGVGGYYLEPKADLALSGSKFTRCSVTLKDKAVQILTVGNSGSGIFKTLGLSLVDCDFEVEDAAVDDKKCVTLWNCHGALWDHSTLLVKNAGGSDPDDDTEPLAIYGCDSPIFRRSEFRAFSRVDAGAGQAGFLSLRDNTINDHGTNHVLWEDNYAWSDYLCAQFGGSGDHTIRRSAFFGGMKARTPNAGWTLLIANGTKNNLYESILAVGKSNRTILFRSGGGGDKLINSTVVSLSGPALEIYGDQQGQVTTRNNIFVSSDDVAVRKRAGAATLNMDYDLLHRTSAGAVIEGTLSGTHGITGDPKFVGIIGSTNYADYALQAGSPAIDKGDRTAVVSDKDLNGSPRIVGTNVDMGAVEFGTIVDPPDPPDPPDPGTDVLAIVRTAADEVKARMDRLVSDVEAAQG